MRQEPSPAAGPSLGFSAFVKQPEVPGGGRHTCALGPGRYRH